MEKPTDRRVGVCVGHSLKTRPMEFYHPVEVDAYIAQLEQRAAAAAAALKVANEHAEKFEREMYLMMDKAEAADAKLAELCDSQYIAGLQAGFRLGDAGDNEGLNRATANYRQQIIDSRKATTPAAILRKIEEAKK